MKNSKSGLIFLVSCSLALCGCTKKDSEVVNRKATTSDTFEYQPSPAVSSAPASAEASAALPQPASRAASGKPFQYKPNPRYFPDAAKATKE